MDSGALMIERKYLLAVFALTALTALAGLGALLWHRSVPRLDADKLEALYAHPAPWPEGPQRAFHLGHSLVARDMPAMLAQLAGEAHSYHSQLGWGTPLRSHWDPDIPIKGFDTENAHSHYRDAHEAMRSGAYDLLILTEMVEIKHAIQYHDSARYLANWAQEAWAANPAMRIYLYETWPSRKDPEVWLARLDQDLPTYWQREILNPALAELGGTRPIYLIPAGQVMAALNQRLLDQGPVGGVSNVAELLKDDIHFNDWGAYLVALTHYAVLYQRNPVGLPHQLLRADGTPADAPPEDLARVMQETVWQVVTTIPETGVPAGT